MPTPAELRELAGELTPKARAIIAWGVLSREAQRGYYETVEFDDPIVNAAIRNIGGWEYVTTIDDKREWESFVRQRFEAAYVALYQRGISIGQGAPLLGYHERENALSGHDTSQPIRRIETGLPQSRVHIDSRRDAPRTQSGPRHIGEALPLVQNT